LADWRSAEEDSQVLDMIEANWIAFALALVIGLLVAWWLFGRGSRDTRERSRRPDVLDEGAAPAQRNQALIDAPSAVKAAFYADTGPDIFGGIGEVFAAAATSEVADAEGPPPPATASAPGEVDDLRRIKGVGPKLAALLHGLGITRYSQIAGWTEADIDRIDPQLGAFAGRIRRDNWVEQATFLAAGDTAGFEAKFGKL
jgi:predicted flap endonuclease-1-like 5' DNA nuclease